MLRSYGFLSKGERDYLSRRKKVSKTHGRVLEHRIRESAHQAVQDFERFLGWLEKSGKKPTWYTESSKKPYEHAKKFFALRGGQLEVTTKTVVEGKEKKRLRKKRIKVYTFDIHNAPCPHCGLKSLIIFCRNCKASFTHGKMGSKNEFVSTGATTSIQIKKD